MYSKINWYFSYILALMVMTIKLDLIEFFWYGWRVKFKGSVNPIQNGERLKKSLKMKELAIKTGKNGSLKKIDRRMSSSVIQRCNNNFINFEIIVNIVDYNNPVGYTEFV